MKKQQLIETAHDIFYQQGFHACGVDLLARQAGTTKRTLYAHFGNKEGLITAALDYRHQWFMERLKEALDKLSDDSLIEGYLLFLENWISSENFYGCMFINACGEFSDPVSAPHKASKAHKKDVLGYLKKRIGNDEVADLLFLYGEGLIVSSQAQGKLCADNKDYFLNILRSKYT